MNRSLFSIDYSLVAALSFVNWINTIGYDWKTYTRSTFTTDAVK